MLRVLRLRDRAMIRSSLVASLFSGSLHKGLLMNAVRDDSRIVCRLYASVKHKYDQETERKLNGSLLGSVVLVVVRF